MGAETPDIYIYIPSFLCLTHATQVNFTNRQAGSGEGLEY